MNEINSGPLILIFSPQEKIRNILSAGFIQSNYRIIEAKTSYIAGIKANQYLPDIVIADITENNIKDFLFLSRLERSVRMQNISVLISVTSKVRKALDKIHKEVAPVEKGNKDNKVHIIEYPFNFSKLIKKVDTILSDKNKRAIQESEDSTTSNEVLGEQLFDLQIPVQNKLKLIENSIDKQWAFPFTIIRSLEIIGSKKSCCSELARCIESDVAAASALLNIANKIHYASRYKRITKVLDAVVRIGFNETRNIIASLALIDISPDTYSKYGFKRSEFWMHSLATAIIAEKLCKNIKAIRPELAFISGLMHDIGKIPIDNNFTDIFSQLLEKATTNITAFNNIEKQYMGFTHADLAHYFTSNWNFPSYITLALMNHHNPNKILNTKISSDRILQESVYVGNILAKALSLGYSCDEIICSIPAKMLKDLGIPNGPSKQFIKKVFETVKLYYEYLKLSKQDVILSETKKSVKEIKIYAVSHKKTVFHPLLMALENNGFSIKITKNLPEKTIAKGAIAIFLPDKDSPLDITLTADDTSVSQTSFLKIFLLDEIKIDAPDKYLTKNNFLIMNSNSIDLRLILQIIEDYYYSTTME